jgi:hypothetical protein
MIVAQASLYASSPRLATGIRIIVTYKSVKALLEVLLAIALPALILVGAAEHLHSFVLGLRHHGVSAWSMRLADLLVTATTGEGGHRISARSPALSPGQYGTGILPSNRCCSSAFLLQDFRLPL